MNNQLGRVVGFLLVLCVSQILGQEYIIDGGSGLVSPDGRWMVLTEFDYLQTPGTIAYGPYLRISIALVNMTKHTKCTCASDTILVDSSGYRGSGNFVTSWMPDSRRVVYSRSPYGKSSGAAVYVRDLTSCQLSATLSKTNHASSGQMLSTYTSPIGLFVKYALPKDGRYTASIISPEGRTVRSVWDGTKARGEYSYRWDGCDDYGIRVASGQYLFRIIGEGSSLIDQAILLR